MLNIDLLFQMLLLANLVCSESGWDKTDGKYVLVTLQNRARNNGTSLMEEALKPNQYSLSNCRNLKYFHLELASSLLSGKIIVKEPPMALATHFASVTALSRPHRKCRGSTVLEVWEHAGYEVAHKSKSGHVYFYPKNSRSKPGSLCPPKKVDGNEPWTDTEL